MTKELEKLLLKPIGVAHTSMRLKFDAPHQPKPSPNDRNIIELYRGSNFDRALQDLQGFDRIWVVWWFHRNDGWRPQVLPPRGNLKRRGVFATRSPYRPNPIGLTSTPLYEVKGLKLTVGSLDLIDGTPILDIKPYIASVDSFPEARDGWLAEVEAELKSPPRFSLSFSSLAREQLSWLKEEWKIDFLERAVQILERDPHPHRTRRITRSAGRFRMGCGAWRLFFSVQSDTVLIEEIQCGYPKRLLHQDNSEQVPDREAQLAFEAKWPE